MSNPYQFLTRYGVVIGNHHEIKHDATTYMAALTTAFGIATTDITLSTISIHQLSKQGKSTEVWTKNTTDDSSDTTFNTSTKIFRTEIQPSEYAGVFVAGHQYRCHIQFNVSTDVYEVPDSYWDKRYRDLIFSANYVS